MNRFITARTTLWALVISGFAIYLTTGLKINTDISGFLPESSDPATSVILEQFKSGPASRVLFVSLSGSDPDALAEASRSLVEDLRKSDDFKRVENGTPSAQEDRLDFAYRYRYVLSDSDYEQSMSVEGFSDALQRYLEMLRTPLAGVFKKYIPGDPSGEMLQIIQDWTHSVAARKISSHRGVWFDRDRERALILAELRESGFKIDRTEKAYNRIQNFQFNESINVDVDITGAGAFSVISRKLIQNDTLRIAAISLPAVLALLIFVYRNTAVPLMITLPVLSGLVVGLGFVDLVFGSVHGITLAFGATIMGESIDYPGYLLSHIKKSGNVYETRNHLRSTLLLAALTTAFGSLSLIFSGFEGLAQLGILTIIGVFTAAIVTLYVLPDLITQSITDRRIDRSLIPWSQLKRFHWLKWIYLPVAFGSLVLLFLFRNDLWNDDLGSFNPVPADLKRLDSSIRKQLGGVDMRYIMFVMASDREKALQKTEVMAARLQAAKSKGFVEGYDAVTDLLPSRKEQQNRIESLPDLPLLRQNLQEAASDSPFSPEIFGSFYDAIRGIKQNEVDHLVDYREHPLASRIDAQLISQNDRVLSLIPLRHVSDPAALLEELKTEREDDGRELEIKTGVLKKTETATMGGGESKGELDFQFIDVRKMTSHMLQGYRKAILTFSMLGLIGIAGIILVVTRRPGQSMWTIFPVLLTAITLMGYIRLFYGPLNLFHLVSFLLVVGIGTNYSLFFNRRQEQEISFQLTELALTICAVSTVITFGVMAFSDTMILSSIGVTVLSGTILSIVTAAVFAPQQEGAQTAQNTNSER